MKKFILKLILLVMILSAIPLCIYFVDPSHVYDGGKYEKSIVDILISGKNATNSDANLNERFLKRFLIQRYSKNVDHLILGPSRTMLISEKVLQDGNVLNLSLSGASLEDMISMYYITKRSGIKVKNMIICLDPQLFNENNADTRWKDNATYYNAFIHNEPKVKEETSMANMMRLKNLFSMSYFQSSVKVLAHKIEDTVKGNQIVLTATNNYDNPGKTIHDDGSLSYDEKFRNPEQKDVNIAASKWTYQQFDSYDNLSDKYKKELQIFIDYVKKDGVQIRVFCAPYHPIVYHKIMSQKHYEYARFAMDYIHKFSVLNNLEIIGSYNPDNCGCNETCFYDGVHLNDKGIGIIFKKR
ncbi:MAG: hypothetical protein PHP34_01540 [Bacteroidales bacterium]|nr:hypothetical protein [Bacteroidales bacterium]